MALNFFDMAVSTTPPAGHLEPLPLTLGPNRQPNDVRLFLISASGSGSSTTLMMQMNPDAPTGFTAAYSLNPGVETEGVYYRRILASDVDTSVNWVKPPGWRHFMLSTLTVRGVSPTAAPTGGRLKVAYTGGAATATVSSVTVPTAGTMLFFIGTVPDPGDGWASWAVSMGAPTGWTNLVATDKSGTTFYAFDDNPGLMVVAKSYTTSGSTGSVSVPVALGQPAFAGLYMFLQPAVDVSGTIGAA